MKFPKGATTKDNLQKPVKTDTRRITETAQDIEQLSSEVHFKNGSVTTYPHDYLTYDKTTNIWYSATDPEISIPGETVSHVITEYEP